MLFAVACVFEDQSSPDLDALGISKHSGRQVFLLWPFRPATATKAASFSDRHDFSALPGSACFSSNAQRHYQTCHAGIAFSGLGLLLPESPAGLFILLARASSGMWPAQHWDLAN